MRLRSQSRTAAMDYSAAMLPAGCLTPGRRTRAPSLAMDALASHPARVRMHGNFESATFVVAEEQKATYFQSSLIYLYLWIARFLSVRDRPEHEQESVIDRSIG